MIYKLMLYKGYRFMSASLVTYLTTVENEIVVIL
jgi:hypothetical protein